MSRERDYLDSFLTYIDAERKLSVHKESAYSRDLEDFILYLEGHEISIDDFSILDARDYVRNLKTDWAEKTVKRKISAIRTFFSYLQKREYIIKIWLHGHNYYKEAVSGKSETASL